MDFCEHCFVYWDDIDATGSAGIPGPDNSFLLLRPKCPRCGGYLSAIGIFEGRLTPSVCENDPEPARTATH